jgi:hypothetical protein
MSPHPPGEFAGTHGEAAAHPTRSPSVLGINHKAPPEGAEFRSKIVRVMVIGLVWLMTNAPPRSPAELSENLQSDTELSESRRTAPPLPPAWLRSKAQRASTPRLMRDPPCTPAELSRNEESRISVVEKVKSEPPLPCASFPSKTQLVNWLGG